MAKTRQITLKGWGNTTCYLTNQNVSGSKAKQQFDELLQGELKGYVKLPTWATSFRDIPESRGCDKVIVKAWHWRGNWSDPTKEVYARLYLPKTTELKCPLGGDESNDCTECAYA